MRYFFCAFLMFITALEACNKKQQEQILERKLGKAYRNYVLILSTSANLVKDSVGTGFHMKYDSIIINQFISLEIDSSAKELIYNGSDIFHSSDSSLNNYSCYNSRIDPKIQRQDLKLRNDSLFVNQTIMVGNIANGHSYIGVRIY